MFSLAIKADICSADVSGFFYISINREASQASDLSYCLRNIADHSAVKKTGTERKNHGPILAPRITSGRSTGESR